MSLQGNDAAIFELMHALLENEGRSQKMERRTNNRLPFQQTQLIAPCYSSEGDVGAEDFEKRDCNDLSVSGMSYFSATRPKHTHVVLALGRVPFKFLCAEIRHAREMDDGRWLVGCHFVKRLS